MPYEFGIGAGAPEFGIGDRELGAFPIAPKTLPTSQFGNPATFTAAANKQASDYDTIMGQYANYVKNVQNNPLTSTNITAATVSPTTAPYSQSADVTGSLANLSNLTSTGGYTPQGIQDIRERAISPIRSIYATGQQELERNRALQGGYSPSFNAASVQMNRDLANKIGDITTNTNAQIAEDIARNKISTAGTYAGAAGSANQLKTSADLANTNIINQINQGNAQAINNINADNARRQLEAGIYNRQNVLGGIQGQTNLYGTTPALTNLFGNQVMQGIGANQNQQALTQQGLGQFLRY